MFCVTGERILRNSKKSSSKVKGVSELPARESPQGFSARSAAVARHSVCYISGYNITIPEELEDFCVTLVSVVNQLIPV